MFLKHANTTCSVSETLKFFSVLGKKKKKKAASESHSPDKNMQFSQGHAESTSLASRWDSLVQTMHVLRLSVTTCGSPWLHQGGHSIITELTVMFMKGWGHESKPVFWASAHHQGHCCTGPDAGAPHSPQNKAEGCNGWSPRDLPRRLALLFISLV